MSVKDDLQIYLITYNRKDYAKRTLDYILDETSPIKDFNITILDNASTDGTSEMLEDYCKRFKNLKHVRHEVNIGGNANICRAYEMAATCGKKYFWVICDDDKYDFSNWKEVENCIRNNEDAICLCDYVFPNKKSKKDLSYLLVQLTFVPAGIYKTELITDYIITNMYVSIYTMFQQLCIVCNLTNNDKPIHILEKPIVFNGMHYKDHCKDASYTRGVNKKETLFRKLNTTWILGFSNILTLLKDKKLAQKSMVRGLTYKDMYGNFLHFYNTMIFKYMKPSKFQYWWEIFMSLSLYRKLEMLLHAVTLGILVKIIYIYKTGDGIWLAVLGEFKTRLIKFKQDNN